MESGQSSEPLGEPMSQSSELLDRLAQVRLLAMDVDGVLTDGTLAYDDQGGEQKRFHVADGLGMVLLRLQGIEIAWISGRKSALVERRAKELGVINVVQGIRDKRAALHQAAQALQIPLAAVAYIGDDWNDLPAFDVAGIRIAVADANGEVQVRADLVTQRQGGRGAVREVCEMLLKARGSLEECMQTYLKSLKLPFSSGQSGQ